MLPVLGPETAAMTTRDGVRLEADIYRPDAPGPWPVLLMRQPYGRRVASTLVYAHPAWYGAHGYIVAIQDVRGSGTSDGAFRLFAHEAADGAEAVAWAAALPDSTGRVGMYGFSYQGVTQLLALGAPALAALCPAMVGWDIREDWAYEGGAFCLSGGLGWGLQMAAEQARRAGDAGAFNALLAASRAPPFSTGTPCRPPVIEAHRQYGHYHDWLEHPAPGPYWNAISPRAALADRQIDVPMLHIGGWYDSMLSGTLACHAHAVRHATAPQMLVVGPWTHQPWGRRVGTVDFGPEAVGRIDALQLAWFDRHLKGEAAEVGAPVQLFDLLAKTWRAFDALPAPEPTPFFLAGDGLAAATQDSRLLRQPAAEVVVDRFVHDPWRPVPVFGGHNAQPGGMQERGALDDRFDVLTYTTDPLPAPIQLAGAVEAMLWIEADAPSFDISAVLSVVTPEGRVFNLTQGYRRLDTAAPEVSVSMRAVCATVPAGHALRLSLAGACFPAFPVNPGTGAPAADARLIDNRVVTYALSGGGWAASRLLLPVA